MTQQLSPAAAAMLEAEVLRGKVRAAEDALAQAQQESSERVQEAEKRRDAAIRQAEAAFASAKKKAADTFNEERVAALASTQEAEEALRQARESLQSALSGLRAEHGVSLEFERPQPGGRVNL